MALIQAKILLYHSIQAGSIDGTDILPHNNAIYRAHLCASAGLCIYTPLSLSSNSHNSNSTPHFLLFLQMTLLAIPRSSETLTASSLSTASLATPPKTLFARSLLFSTLSHSLFGCRESLKETKKI